MVVRKIVLLALIAPSVLLIACSRKEPGANVPQPGSDMVCLSRADLTLLLASGNGDTQTMESALKAGANVNTSVEGLGAPIVASAMSRNYTAVKLLLDKGANVNAADSQGYTALINASLSNSQDIVPLLISRGADVNAPASLTINGRKARMTPLLIAKERNYQEVVKLLTDAGATQ
jgi:ankyrin repeat protein